MENNREIYEVVKEYFIHVPGMDERVHGRICRLTVTNDRSHVRYTYDMSHFFIPRQGGVYHDEVRSVQSLELAETELLMYLRDFTVEHGKAKENTYYFRNR